MGFARPAGNRCKRIGFFDALSQLESEMQIALRNLIGQSATIGET